MTITLREELVDGRKIVYVVDGWPATASFTDVLLADADPELIRRDGDRIEIKVVNGSATYRDLRFDEETRVWAGRLADSVWWPESIGT